MMVFKELVAAAACVALIAASQTLFAADDAKHPCAHVRDSADRLACYDQAFGKPADAAAAAPREQFGFKEKEVERQAGKSAEPAAQANVTAAIISLARQADGKFIVTLDNAQVWSQSEFNSQADLRVGDPVTVRRAALGSYLLVTKAGIATRVKRLK